MYHNSMAIIIRFYFNMVELYWYLTLNYVVNKVMDKNSTFVLDLVDEYLV